MSAKRTELGCPGHFIAVESCHFRRHTQIGKSFRVSTIGDYYPERGGGRKTIGLGDDSFFETYVFATAKTQAPNNEGCGCLEVKSWTEIDGVRTPTAKAAQAAHERFVRKYMAKAGGR